MTASSTAFVTPQALRWARESSGYSLEEAAKRIAVTPAKLAFAEQGKGLLTLRQAEKAAEVYERPLAALFLETPPSEEIQKRHFRQLRDAPPPPWPPAMQILARRVLARQEAAVELLDLMDEQVLWPKLKSSLKGVSLDGLPEYMRTQLGIDLGEQVQWRDRTGYLPLKNWIGAAEDIGILVMQSGTVPVQLVRGFASPHDSVPAIVLNAQDDPRARVFTCMHELGHLCLSTQAVELGDKVEAWCDEFAGRILMPSDAFMNEFTTLQGQPPLQMADKLSLIFGVTPQAVAVKLSRLGIYDDKEFGKLVSQIRARGSKNSRSRGGDYYRNEIARLGPAFIRLVFSAMDNQALTYPAASRLLGVKVNNFAKLRQTLDDRVETA